MYLSLEFLMSSGGRGPEHVVLLRPGVAGAEPAPPDGDRRHPRLVRQHLPAGREDGRPRRHRLQVRAAPLHPEPAAARAAPPTAEAAESPQRHRVRDSRLPHKRFLPHWPSITCNFLDSVKVIPPSCAQKWFQQRQYERAERLRLRVGRGEREQRQQRPQRRRRRPHLQRSRPRLGRRGAGRPRQRRRRGGRGAAVPRAQEGRRRAEGRGKAQAVLRRH